MSSEDWTTDNAGKLLLTGLPAGEYRYTARSADGLVELPGTVLVAGAALTTAPVAFP